MTIVNHHENIITVFVPRNFERRDSPNCISNIYDIELSNWVYFQLIQKPTVNIQNKYMQIKYTRKVL